MKPIKISIVEDNPEYQDWILKEIKTTNNIQCVSRHQTGEEALEKIPELKPDIVLMDLTLEASAIDGIECMLRLKLLNKDLKFLVISSHNDENKIFEALKVGAGAYLHKEEITRKLTEIITEFNAGWAPMSPSIARKVTKSFQAQKESDKNLAYLTEKEEEVLELLVLGYLNKEIAYQLNIEQSAVKQRIYRIYKKLEVNNRVEAMLKYLTNK